MHGEKYLYDKIVKIPKNFNFNIAIDDFYRVYKRNKKDKL
ncbi:hypothetical protein BAN_0900001 [Borrelia anserina BA2]|uniref:Uncharacterized protein n=1 Tax=Borrelia anserina BA2 TaxID=1313293 RepID=W5SNH6_BORAN|nr:hypothetical protein BAN_0900001 [Borrelia anserina BA2]